MWWHTKRFVSKMKKSGEKENWNEIVRQQPGSCVCEICFMCAEKNKHLTCNQPNTSYHRTQNIHNNDNEASNLAMLCTFTMEMVMFSFYILSSCHATYALKAPNRVFRTCWRFIWIWHLLKQGKAYLENLKSLTGNDGTTKQPSICINFAKYETWKDYLWIFFALSFSSGVQPIRK